MITEAPRAELPDFDTLAKLATNDPAAFEALRELLLQQAINDAPERHRAALQVTVSKLNDARKEAKTPLEAATVASRAMSDSFQTMCSTWKTTLFMLNDLGNEAQNLAAKADCTGATPKTFIR